MDDHSGDGATRYGAGTATATRDDDRTGRGSTEIANATTVRIAPATVASAATATRVTDEGRAQRHPGRGDGWIVAAVLAALFVLLLAASVDLVVAVAATAVVGLAAQGLRGGRAPRS